MDIITQLLEGDARPSFIVNLDECDAHRLAYMPVVFHNQSLTRVDQLESLIYESETEALKNPKSISFRFWVTQIAQAELVPAQAETQTFHDITWTAVRMLSSYLLLSGLSNKAIQKAAAKQTEVQEGYTQVLTLDSGPVILPPAVVQTSELSQDDAHHSATRRRDTTHANQGLFEIPWTPQLQYFLDFNWASTSLGPPQSWPDELHQMATLVMCDPQPALLFCGPEYVIIHNTAAIDFFSEVQSVLMGSTMAKVLPGAWASLATIIGGVRTTKIPQQLPAIHALLGRFGRLDEAYISTRYMPVVDKNDRCIAVYQSLTETTRQKLSERRLATLLEVSACATSVKKEQTFWTRLLDALSTNKEDVGFAMIYSVAEPAASDLGITAKASHGTCHLEGALGVADGHANAPDSFDLDQDGVGYCPEFMKALITDAPVVLQRADGTLPEHYVAQLHCRTYSTECHAVVVCPIRPTGGTKVVGFLVMGLSARVACDSEYRQFVDILNRQIATSVASITLFDEEIRQERKKAEEAALVHQQLQTRLDRKHRELLTSEAKFQRIADKNSVAITITDVSGNITYANQAFYILTNHTGREASAESWINLVDPDYQVKAIEVFTNVWATHQDVTFEVKMKKEWVKKIEGVEDVRSSTWLLASCYVEVDEDGQAVSCCSALTDISAQKWAEEVHHRRMIEALELKTQQENFIDIVSHEIRNPLSAILQSADEIKEYLGQTRKSTPSNDVLEPNGINGTLVDSSAEAIDTIMLCCQHQRRVVDDVLTLSKMNSDMLHISPENIDPRGLISSIVGMFRGQAKQQKISLVMDMESSLASAGTLSFDPNRLSQVLVNLLGNAIKFTATSDERLIRVSAGVSAVEPVDGDHGVEYTKSGNMLKEVLVAPVALPTAHENNSSLYLRLVVQDTGIGMRDSEKRKLFKRFAQASPRTYVNYGGSGLGLFISKKLCELQGGAIGLKMGDERGATFAFYISTSRVSDPKAVLPPENLTLHQVPDEQSLQNPIDTSMAKEAVPEFQSSAYALLVVEDNLVNQKVMCRQLRNLGFTVYSASHGADALAFIEQTNRWKGRARNGKPLSLILLDTEMPVMDGLTCIRKIRQLEKEGKMIGHTPAISVSANARFEQIVTAKAAGMDDTVSKPFQIVDLLPKIKNLVTADLTGETV